MRLGILAFFIGVLAASHLPQLPDSVVLLFALPLVILLWLGRRNPVGLSLLAFMLGGLWLMVVAVSMGPQRLPASMEGQTISVIGTVVSIPQNNSQRSRFDFDITSLTAESWKGRVRISWYYPEQPLKAGQQWRFKLKLKRPHGFANPGGFDYESWLYQKGITATGYVREAGTAELLNESSTLNRYRQQLSEKMLSLLGDSATRGLLVALTTGDRQHVESAQWQVLTRTGTIHLMAISGLHIGLLYGLFYWIGLRLWRLSARLCLIRPAQDVAVVLGLLAALFYAALAGFAIPTQRALIMLSVVAYTLLSRRMTTPIDTLLLALLMVLIVDPFAVLAHGFWLSFMAVAVILLFLDKSTENEKLQGKKTTGWQRLLQIQFAIALGLMPLTILFFHQLSLIAPLVNLLAVPWVGLLVVPLTLLGALLSSLWPSLAMNVLALADELMRWLWVILEPASQTSFAVMHPAHPAGWALLLALLGTGLIFLKRKLVFRVVGVVCLTPLLLPGSSSLKAGDFQVDFLDVGQGLTIVVRTEKHTLLYDAGFRAGKDFDIGQRVVIPYFWHQGLEHIDHLILSHDDKDHVGGFAAIANEISVGQLSVMPGSFMLKGNVNASVCEAGQNWRWDGVSFEILYPFARYLSSENNRSCVLKISNGHSTVLLTGDIEAEAEAQLVGRYAEKLRSDVISAPHHGSSTSSTSLFLDHANPGHVVYSMGYRNRFGFPQDDVSERYSARGVRQWRNDDSGMLRFVFHVDNKQSEISEYRPEHRRFWNVPARISHQNDKPSLDP